MGKKIEFITKTNSNGKETIAVNLTNITKILTEHKEFKNTIRFDEFKNRYQVKRDNDKWENLTDEDFIGIQKKIQITFPSVFPNVSKQMVTDAVYDSGLVNKINSGADYIRSIKWDNTPRLDRWLVEAYHAPDNNVIHSIGSNWIKGLVNRAINPGCRFDYVLVLIGDQGTRKSTSFAVLAGEDWHLETDGRIDKDFLQDMEGKLIVEFSEGETLNRTETTKLKSFITKPVDTYRPSYGRVSRDFPRRCVFAMTTNDHEFLKDVTGNRRWLPVEIEGEVDIKWIEKNRDQLFAEAYHRLVDKKETTWEFPDEIREWQEDRRIHDPDEARVVEWYREVASSRRELGISLHEAYVSVFEPANEKAKIDWHSSRLLANTFRHILKLTNRHARIDKYTTGKRWFPTENTPPPSVTATNRISDKERINQEYDSFASHPYDDDDDF